LIQIQIGRQSSLVVSGAWCKKQPFLFEESHFNTYFIFVEDVIFAILIFSDEQKSHLLTA
jgi:hypothetical protein